MTSAERARAWRQTHPARPLLYDARRRARKRGVPFSLEESDIERLLTTWRCVYCDVPIGTFSGMQHPNSATLDRIIPDLGYTPDNTVLACHQCNAAKAEHSPETLRLWLTRIERVLNRKNPKETT